MKLKTVLISLILLGLLAMVILIVTHETSGILVENYDWQDTYIESIGLTPNEFLASQKQTLAEHNYEYLHMFDTTQYIAPSTQEVMFSRNWSHQRLVNEKAESIIDPDVYLFENSDSYYVLATFEIPYSYNSTPQDIGFIDIGFSNNFELSWYYSISYMDKGNQYLLQNGILDSSSGIIPIKQNMNSLGFLNLSKLIYTFTCQIIPSQDNDLEDDMYLSLDLDFYMLIDHYLDTVQIGFNEFKVNTNYNTYSVLRKSTTYQGGI
jgi:hypothetical protein